MVTFYLPEVKSIEENRPTGCRNCGGETFQRWGREVRKVRDPHIKELEVYRYRCCRCGCVFRHYPAGVDQAQQTQRLRALAAVAWALGLSYRGIKGLFCCLWSDD